MSMFGAIYYIVPRLAGCEWLSARLIRQHFWFSVYGIAALVVCMLVGGLAQGASVNSPENWNLPFMGTIVNSRGYLIGRTLAWAVHPVVESLVLLPPGAHGLWPGPPQRRSRPCWKPSTRTRTPPPET